MNDVEHACEGETLTVAAVNRDYMTVADARNMILSLTKQRYAQLIASDGIRSVRVGPHTFVHRGDVERHKAGGSAWLDALHEDGYLTIQEAAQALRLARATLICQERNGALRLERRGTRIVVNRAEVERYGREHRGHNPLRDAQGDAIRALGLAARTQRRAREDGTP